ncbi:hypothetical protein MIMGU_mgv1a020547mg [Erythranthe guttata]|uniref:MADS-box domain-containing protein n=1 Tax=Erythranthe guttata TaxID=4155 RepID=A0A022Q0G9_ERYGU|nr:hypothetical protein MIMGU_mgv1a020547mg [Erythranthe guttata]
MAGRQTRGRQRIPIRLIENQDDLYATFSKRRLGLYKKASELSTLCGVDIGIIIFSPTDNPFSFFHPSMESVIDRFRNPNQPLSDYARVVEAHTRARIDNLNRRLDEIHEEKDRLKEREKELDEIDRNRPKGWWEDTPIESLSPEQVLEWKAWFRAFKVKIQNRISELNNGASTSGAAAAAAADEAAANFDFPPGPSSSTYSPVAFGDHQFATTQYFDAPPYASGGASGSGSGGGGGGQYFVTQAGEGPSGSGSGQFSVPYNFGAPPFGAEVPSASAAGAAGGSGGGGQFPPMQYNYFPPPPQQPDHDNQNQDPTSATVGEYSIQYNYIPRWGQDPSAGGGAGPSHRGKI